MDLAPFNTVQLPPQTKPVQSGGAFGAAQLPTQQETQPSCLALLRHKRATLLASYGNGSKANKGCGSPLVPLFPVS